MISLMCFYFPSRI